MWPNRRLAYRAYQEIQEIDEEQSQSNSFSDEEMETDDDDDVSDSSDTPEDLLLITSIEPFVLSLPSAEMASTRSCIVAPNTYPHIVYGTYPGRSSVDDTPDEQAEDEELNNNTMDNASPKSLISGSNTTSEYVRLPPEPAQARRRLGSHKRMPPPSNLAAQVANRIIKYARCIRNVHEKDMCCFNCGLFPSNPVTGQCGHTRCHKCTYHKNTCPCGNGSPVTSCVNILIRDLIKNITCGDQSCSNVSGADKTPDVNPVGVSTDATNISEQPLCGARGTYFGPIRVKRKPWRSITDPYSGSYQRIPMSPRARYNYALELIKSGRHHEAAPHLALAAASAVPDLRPARILLAQMISILSKNCNPRSLTRPINRIIRHLSSTSWIKSNDMECILCCETFTNPVTTPCGHMFCRTCIERTLDYKKRCPLCRRSLYDFKLTDTRNTVFVQAALRCINAVNTPLPLEPDFIPIFVCTVAYPSVPCPLLIFDPRYWLMIRRVLESGSRKFGMVACYRGREYSSYGTILEVRDCVQMEDGRSILSTVGLSRFKVIERRVRDGCEIARISPIIDVPPPEVINPWDLKILATQILFKALLWLNRLNNKVLADIEAAFGMIPARGVLHEEWWESPDGPSWLWWLVAVLPLRSEIKELILSTDCLSKRMMAVARTLDVVNRVDGITTSSIENSNSSNSFARQ